MKHFYAFLIAILFTSFGFGQTQIYILDFDGNGSYTTSTPEGKDSGTASDYWTSTNGTDITASFTGSSNSGNNFFAGQDMDGVTGIGDVETITISGINIASYTNLQLRVFLAEDDDGGNQDWDTDTELLINYEIDSNGSQNGIHVQSSGGTNSEPAIDTNYDGSGDGAAITDAWSQYTYNISQTGNLMDITITFSFLDAGDEDIAIDDIEIWGDLVSSNDADTEIQAPTTQVSSSTITAANSTTALNAVPVFRYDIEDQGTADGLPTNVTRMRFVPGPNNTADWTDHIQGIVLTDVTGLVDLTPLATVTINDLEIIVDFGAPFVILDNSDNEFELEIYLNVDNIVDGAVVQMQIPDVGSGFLADPSGSTFLEPQPGTITGPQMPIDVIATELEFLPQPPPIVQLNQPIVGLGVQAQDINGNIDTDYNQNIDITSTGTLSSSPVTEMAVNGVATFNTVTLIAEGTGITLTADDSVLPPIVSNPFDVIVCIAIENFDGATPNWSNTTDIAFFDNTWNGDGYFGLIDIGLAAPISFANFSGNILGENDLDDEGNGTTGFATTTFDPVDISLYEDVEISFDWEIINYNANNDDARYEVFFDGVGQGLQFLVDGGVTGPDGSGTVTINVPNVISTVSLVVQIRNNGADGFSAFDNFKITGSFPSIVYNGNNSTGFGGPLGQGSLEIDAFTGPTANFRYNRGPGLFGNNNDYMVIYIDSEAGGISSTANLTDSGDPGRRAVSGFDGTNRSTITFPPGFLADFAIYLDENFAGVFDLVENGSHNFVANANLTPTGSQTESFYDFVVNLIDINATAGPESFKFVATYINSDNAFRSNEFIGDSDYNNDALGNPGLNPTEFITYFQVTSRNKGGQAPTAADGNWTDDASWVNGNPPLEGDAVSVTNNISKNFSFVNRTSLTVDGTLDVQSGFTLTNFSSIDGTGTLSLLSGSSLVLRQDGFTNLAPTYSSGSTLEYRDITGTYNRFTEWGTGATVGIGVPDNVIIDNAELDLSNPSGDTSDESFNLGNDLTLLNGASLNIDPTKNLTVGGDLSNTGSTVTMTSTSTRYPSLIILGSSTGNVNYNRYVNTNDAINGNDLISAPVAGQAFDIFFGNNPNILSNSSGPEVLFGGFDNNSITDPFELWNDTDTTPLAAGIGYRSGIDTAAGSNLVSFDGTVSTGLVEVPIAQGSVSFLNLLGNPFTTFLDAQAFLTQNGALLEPTAQVIYGYNDSTNGTSAGDYTIISALVNNTLNIAPGQAFFVTSNATGGNVQFTTNTPDMRLTSTQDDFIAGRNAASTINNLKLDLSNATDNFITDIFFTQFSSLGLDPGYDASLLGGVAPPFSLYSQLVEDNMDVPFAIQALGKTDFNDVTIPLGVNANSGEQLTFSIIESSLPPAVDVYLDDTVANTSTVLSAADYVITPTVNLNGTGRFYLRFSNNALSTDDNNMDDISIYTNQTNSSINIAGQVAEDTVAYVYDVQGRLVISQDLSSASLLQTIDANDLTSGVYIVKLSNATQQRTQKVILR